MTDLNTSPPPSPTLDSLFVEVESLPSPPVTVLEVVRRSDDPDVQLPELAKLIEFDVALAVQILRVANSALYSPVSEITTIERALTTLGLRSVRLLALSASLRMLIPDQVDAFDTSEIRRRMVINGSLARKFAVAIDRSQQDEAFVAGLLTGLGPVVLASKAREICDQLVSETGKWPNIEAQRELLGFSCDDITANLLRDWALPASLCSAIEGRTSPALEDDSTLQRCLRLSLLAEDLLCGPDPGSALGELHKATEAELGMSAEETNEWLVEAEPLVAQAAELLQFQFPQTQAYPELLVEATLRMQQLALEAHTTIVEGSRELEAMTKRNQRLKHEASTDALTQLANRGHFDEELATQLLESRASVGTGAVGLLIIDLDHFKGINDAYGHSVGDELLRSVGDLLRKQLRGDDLPARFGGDEFVVLLPRTDLAELELVANRLLTNLRAIEFTLPSGEPLQFTVSMGGALSGEAKNETATTLLRRADERLYQAKRQGRNQLSLI
ncbi:MAG: diguanylate cyclase (GGDEF)-like protein [Acidimicrobiales bacterium]